MSHARPARLFLPLLALLAAPVEAGELLLWGDDMSNQISSAPEGEVRAAAGGSIQGIAIRWDRTAKLSGSGLIGATPMPTELTTERFRACGLGRDNAVLIRMDGTLAPFGRSAWVTTNVPAGFYHSVAVAASHAVVIADDGTLAAWGTPAAGQNGLLTMPEGQYRDIEAVVGYSLFLRKDGTLFGSGASPVFTSSPPAGAPAWVAASFAPSSYTIPDRKFKLAAGGNVHALAILDDGTVTGWGNPLDPGALVAPSHVEFKELSCGWGFSVGLTTDGMLWGWGTPHFLTTPFTTAPWTFESLTTDPGPRGPKWARYGTTNYWYVPDERFESVATSAFHIMAITDDHRGHGHGQDGD